MTLSEQIRRLEGGLRLALQGRAYMDALRLVNELELYEALAGVEHVRVRPAPADRPGRGGRWPRPSGLPGRRLWSA